MPANIGLGHHDRRIISRLTNYSLLHLCWVGPKSVALVAVTSENTGLPPHLQTLQPQAVTAVGSQCRTTAAPTPCRQNMDSGGEIGRRDTHVVPNTTE